MRPPSVRRPDTGSRPRRGGVPGQRAGGLGLVGGVFGVVDVVAIDDVRSAVAGREAEHHRGVPSPRACTVEAVDGNVAGSRYVSGSRGVPGALDLGVLSEARRAAVDVSGGVLVVEGDVAAEAP